MGKYEGKRTLERPRCRWGDNIKIDLKVMGCEGMGQLIGLRIGTSGRLVCIVMVS